MKSMPPPLPLLCSSAFVVLLLLLCRPLVANGRATPPSPGWPSAAQPALQPAPTASGGVASADGAAAVLPAAAAPPPLGRLECWIKTFALLFARFQCVFAVMVRGS